MFDNNYSGYIYTTYLEKMYISDRLGHALNIMLIPFILISEVELPKSLCLFKNLHPLIILSTYHNMNYKKKEHMHYNNIIVR